MAGDVTPDNLTNAHHRELLRIDYRSLGIEIDFSGSEIAGSLWGYLKYPCIRETAAEDRVRSWWETLSFAVGRAADRGRGTGYEEFYDDENFGL